MPKEIDISQKRFGKLTAIKKAKPRFWLFRCDCGKTKVINKSNVIAGKVKSCGCLSEKMFSEVSNRKTMSMIGKRFGRLTVLKRIGNYVLPSGHKCSKWLCSCSCGKTTEVLGDNLEKGNTLSCGCLKREIIKNGAHKTHGMRKTRLYEIWAGMIQRTTNTKSKSYKNYGGRGITVCNEWKNSFEEFFKWAIKNGYNKELTIDRVNNNGNYCPENCRWSTQKQQARNKRTNHFITYNGETHCMSEWEEILGDKRRLLSSRKNHGWSIERIMSFYNPKDYVTQHDYDKEQEIIARYEQEGLLKVNE